MPDPHQPLRDDVRLLGELLGDVLRTHAGIGVYGLVEQVRQLAKRARAGEAAEFDDLASRLEQMPIDHALPVARAFSHFLTLANIAEQHHRTRRRRAYRRTPDGPPQRGSCEQTFRALIAAGVSPGRLHAGLCSLRIELVLTAHPTEVVRRTLIQKHNRIAQLLAVRDRSDLTIPERDETDLALHREVLSSWETDEIRHEPPNPLDEVRSGLVVFEQTLWDALPAYLRSVDRALQAATGEGLPFDAAPIRFGSWMGGDRDGNPYVTPEVTWHACLLARWMAADLYIRDVESLRAELSMTVASDELRDRTRGAPEPYRALLRELRDRLVATRDALAAGLQREGLATWPLPSRDPRWPICTTAADLAEPLHLCARSLRATGTA